MSEARLAGARPAHWAATETIPMHDHNPALNDGLPIVRPFGRDEEVLTSFAHTQVWSLGR